MSFEQTWKFIRNNKFKIFVISAFTILVMGIIGYLVNIVFGLMFVSGNEKVTEGLLYPRESETREVRSLDGMWKFARSNVSEPLQGIREKWFLTDLENSAKVMDMPVPSSYNDITEDDTLRDHVGTVWYERHFFVPKSWADQVVWIRFGSVHYEAYVYINGNLVVKHEFGHLPFEADISKVVKYGQQNRVTVICDNVLLQTTIPQGNIVEMQSDTGAVVTQTYSFDFFNYAGIHRSVMLYTTPKIYVKHVKITTDVIDTEGSVHYKITTSNDTEDVKALIRILDKKNNVVASQYANEMFEGAVTINNATLWWPFLMHPEPGYMYTIEVHLNVKNQIDNDIYRMKFGIRTLKWTNTQFLINNKPIYFRGFGRHEDSDIRGKGLDYALLTKDFNLLRWIGANSYRTSHYPYSEESMQFADENGIMIIDECPSVDTENYSQTLMDKHKFSIEQLIHRDAHHPSVVMWSIANEPRTNQLRADTYFSAIANYTRFLDPSRPVTASIAVALDQDKAAQYLDILSFNRYNAWYSNSGKLNMIKNRVIEEATNWHLKHNKPVLMSEYGSDTVEGLHILPAYVWSEEFQVQQFSKHFEAFDYLRNQGFFIGEFVWNFADFKTAQTYTRVGGNKKGVFTRARQPKAAAHHLRKRYFELAHDIENFTNIPDDLYVYTSPHSAANNYKDEL